MSFGVDEVETIDPNSPQAKMIAEGQKLYEAQKFDEASLLFYRVTQEADGSPYALQAQYELGKSLFRMGLYQGALSYFGRVVDAGESHPYFLPTLRGLVLLTEEIPSDQTLMARLAVYEPNYPADVAEKFRPAYAYLVGRYFQTQGEYDRALRLLSDVPPSSEYYLKARYIEGITHVSRYDAKQAVRALKDVLRPLTAALEEGSLEPEQRKLLEMSWMAMARVFYSTGEYNKSVKYYSLIPRASERWPASLFESSYAYFQLDLANKALGNLHTLNSPFFQNTYAPEAPILAGVIYFYNCKYRRVAYELEEFEYAYLPIKEELDALLARNEEPAEMHAWLKKLRSGEVAEEDEKLRRILAASLADKEVQSKVALLEEIEAEFARMEDKPEAWRSSDLGASLIQDATIAREFGITEAGELVQRRLERVRAEIVDLNVSRQRILFEVERARRGEVEAELAAEMEAQANVTDRNAIPVSDEQMAWTFDGEYWKDELGFYFFSVNSECRR